ncbi:hypothetical protein [Nitratidesulfovibrio liaohensis]|uniref:Uncharacterized protein n=1 Tax=Nitratidesulfovibrio liaohensis TaxID=2604158 RepID=A0ABY9R283_9BACT|nr:hypothetical protein [Nitratidesulfovibrio liaohensis]WMW65732.1 hypothetical protein KPS_000240 [Nitratidesulfovibrio liaohensis]
MPSADSTPYPAAQGHTASLLERTLIARAVGEELVLREINRRWELVRAQGATFDMNPARGTACVRRPGVATQ